MFECAIAINEFQCKGFEKVAADISEQSFFEAGAGHGHSPAWIIGHLALSAEAGMQSFGRAITHPEWSSLFGPGTRGLVDPSESLSKEILQLVLLENYRQLREFATNASPEAMSQTHRVPFFRGTSIKTVGDCITLLLTSHFGFHLSQLSSCRRAAGFGPLF
ncbi:MAG TPA: DinB family protein [Schlesneria sp.]|jgi:hypothetical protein